MVEEKLKSIIDTFYTVQEAEGFGGKKVPMAVLTSEKMAQVTVDPTVQYPDLKEFDRVAIDITLPDESTDTIYFDLVSVSANGTGLMLNYVVSK